MIKFTIDLRKPRPVYLHNWTIEHGAKYLSWKGAMDLFHHTTNGRMELNSGATTYDLVFENDSDAAWFILKYG